MMIIRKDVVYKYCKRTYIDSEYACEEFQSLDNPFFPMRIILIGGGIDAE
jgi:hypothetical protein